MERGLKVLSYIASADRPVGITDLNRQLGLAKGSIARLVATLLEQDFLVRDPDTAKYRVGIKMWTLGHQAVAKIDIGEIAQSVMADIHAATQETVHLTVLSDTNQMVILRMMESTKAIRPNLRLGANLPPHCVANGKAVLAYLTQARFDQILSRDLERFTATTISRKNELLKSLSDVRRLGYAENRGEYREDVSGLAAPIRNHLGIAIAALGLSIPTSRMTDDFVRSSAPLLVEGAQKISRTFGLLDDESREDLVTHK